MLAAYQHALADGAMRPDPAQAAVAEKLGALAEDLGKTRWFGRRAPGGLYIWGDVGRGKTALMDLFFEEAGLKHKRRVHFNAFMADVHARIHAARQAGVDDPIPVVARALANDAWLLCFDEFQVADVADAMILGRLFDRLFAEGVTIVATSNTPPDNLYAGGLNRQLFLPFIEEIKARLDVVALNGPVDYRQQRLAGINVYWTPLGPAADAGMDAAWIALTGGAKPAPMRLPVLGREVAVPCAAAGVARFAFADLCLEPLAAVDYLAVGQRFHAVLIDHIPVIETRDAARRFILLIDTLYDMGVKLVCSAAAMPEDLYPAGTNDAQVADAFRRTASRLAEMQSDDYLRRGHGIGHA